MDLDTQYEEMARALFEASEFVPLVLEMTCEEVRRFAAILRGCADGLQEDEV